MSKSQETFNKKDKEKKRLKKRQDKQLKKEERKAANSEKGKSFDDMIAYVDEFGNITDTPPDPKAKTKIIMEDIQISISRQPEPDPSELIRTGTITHFNSDKGYGFIRDSITQESVFVHINALSETVHEGDKVTFETEKGPKGLNAVNVTKNSPA